MSNLKKALFRTCPKLSLFGSAFLSLAYSREVQRLGHFNLEVACLDLRLLCQFWICVQQSPPVLVMPLQCEETAETPRLWIEFGKAVTWVLLPSVCSRTCFGASCTRTDKRMVDVLPSLLCLSSPSGGMLQFRSPQWEPWRDKECMCFHVKFLMLEFLRHVHIP